MKTVHLIKLAVGVEDLDHLAQLQRARLEENAARGLSPHPRHVTRMRPRREKEVLHGGSMYWVIKGVIRARQHIVALEDVMGEDGVKRCAIVLDPELVPTQARAHRAFQGWRYLDPAKAPPDGRGDEADLPADLARDLDALGLL